MRLIAMSKASLYTTDEDEGRYGPVVGPTSPRGGPLTQAGCGGGRCFARTAHSAKDPTSVVYDIVLELAQETDANEASYAEALARTLRKGYKQSDLDEALKEYEELNVWVVSRDKTKIRLINDINMDDA